MHDAIVTEKEEFTHLTFKALYCSCQAGWGYVAVKAGFTKMKAVCQMPEKFQFTDVHGLRGFSS